MAEYREPVKALLQAGKEHGFGAWPDYVKTYGFSEADIPDLIRMATDEDLYSADLASSELWAPIHAWRALGQLKAEAAIEPLITLLQRIDELDDDWVDEEMKLVFGMVGPAAIDPLARYLGEPNHGEFARIAAAEGLRQIAQQHPEVRDRVVGVLAAELGKFADQPTVNGFLVGELVELRAVERAKTIEDAYFRNCVDESVYGDWREIQTELGLRPPRKRLPSKTLDKLMHAVDGVIDPKRKP
jgi:hypothetical protein